MYLFQEGQGEKASLSRDDGVPFWNQLWEQGRIKGFHESDLNEYDALVACSVKLVLCFMSLCVLR